MKAFIARCLRSECLLWASVITFSSVYAYWLCYGDTRAAQRVLAKGIREVRAHLPGGGESTRRATQQIDPVNRDVIETVSQSPQLRLPEHALVASKRRSVSKTPNVDSVRQRDAKVKASDVPTLRVALTSGDVPQTNSHVDDRDQSPSENVPHREMVPIPSFGVAAFEEGLTSFRRGAYGQAVRDFATATWHAPDRATYRYFLALSQYRTGRRDEADHQLVRATELEAIKPEPELGRLLRSVQGADRIWLESARRQARVGPYQPRQ